MKDETRRETHELAGANAETLLDMPCKPNTTTRTNVKACLPLRPKRVPASCSDHSPSPLRRTEIHRMFHVTDTVVGTHIQSWSSKFPYQKTSGLFRDVELFLLLSEFLFPPGQVCLVCLSFGLVVQNCSVRKGETPAHIGSFVTGLRTDKIPLLQVETIEMIESLLGLMSNRRAGMSGQVTTYPQAPHRPTSIRSSNTTNAVPRVFGPLPSRICLIAPYLPNRSYKSSPLVL